MGINTINILIVDDKVENLISLENALEQPNRKFYRALTGKEALKLSLSIDFGLVLLDVQMPDMDGFEVAQFFKSHPKTKDIAIIFVTAIIKEDKYVLQGYEDGAVDYLQKPLDIHILRAKVKVFEKLYLNRKEIHDKLKEIMQINEQLDQFVSVVSHDLKTPLNGILNLINFIDEDLEEKNYDELLNNLNLIKNSAQNLKIMINGILEYSRMSRNKTNPEMVDINQLLDELISTLLVNNKVKVNISPNIPNVFAEKVKLRQVFQNIIDNSIKYNDKKECIININCKEENEFLEFSIEDNGPGIPENMHEWVFGLFKTISKATSESSTGIGLSLIKTIIEDQGGKIWIKNNKEVGTTFIFDWMK